LFKRILECLDGLEGGDPPSSPNITGQAGLYSTISILGREAAGISIPSRLPLE
jgi:hypothetical protein